MRFYIVDVFAEGPYTGNPLAVLVLDRDVSADEMQRIAREVGFSETTFVAPSPREDGSWPVRVFTPDLEIPFAGHPSLGTAFVVREVLGDPSEVIRLSMGVGTIPVQVGPDGLLTMRQNQPQFGEVVEPDVVASVLSVEAGDLRGDLPIQWASTGLPCYCVPTATLDALGRMHVDHPQFKRFFGELGHDKCNLLAFVELPDGSLRARCFMDDTGFAEDPATGSANGDLAACLLHHGRGNGRLEYVVDQGVEMGRPSRLFVSASVDGTTYDIRVGGHCRLVARGEWA